MQVSSIASSGLDPWGVLYGNDPLPGRLGQGLGWGHGGSDGEHALWRQDAAERLQLHGLGQQELAVVLPEDAAVRAVLLVARVYRQLVVQRTHRHFFRSELVHIELQLETPAAVLLRHDRVLHLPLLGHGHRLHLGHLGHHGRR